MLKTIKAYASAFVFRALPIKKVNKKVNSVPVIPAKDVDSISLLKKEIE